MEFAAGDAREEVVFLRVGAERHDRRGDRVDGEERDGHACDGGLVGEDELVGQGAILSAELLRPAEGEEPCTSELGDDVAVGATVAVLAGGGGEGLAALRCHELREELAQLAPEFGCGGGEFAGHIAGSCLASGAASSPRGSAPTTHIEKYWLAPP